MSYHIALLLFLCPMCPICSVGISHAPLFSSLPRSPIYLSCLAIGCFYTNRSNTSSHRVQIVYNGSGPCFSLTCVGTFQQSVSSWCPWTFSHPHSLFRMYHRTPVSLLTDHSSDCHTPTSWNLPTTVVWPKSWQPPFSHAHTLTIDALVMLTS